MKFIFSNNLLTALIVTSFAFYSCKKLVDVPPPNGQLTNASTFNDDHTATAAQFYLYTNGLSSDSYNMSQRAGLLSDELNGSYSQSPDVKLFYLNALNPIATTITSGPWYNAYNNIRQINSIIEGLGNSKGASLNVRHLLTGESLFLRAFEHFYLTNCYGDIPLVTTTDYKINAVLPRSPQQKVYLQIISDLQMAQNLLTDDYVDATDTAITFERVRPIKWAAMALLARVFLYTHNYDSAEFYSNAVINHTALYNLTDSVDDVFKKNSSEAIWQLAPSSPPRRNTLDGDNFTLISAPSNGSTNTATISTQLLNSFEIGDKRKSHWINYITFDTSTYYYPYKYKAYRSTTVTEYTMMLRLAEQYLIRAEARTLKSSPDFSGAVADINKIRYRAGLNEYSGTVDQPSIMSAIMQERRVELFAEWGHRWFDLIRTGSANAVMSVVAPQKGGTWDASGYQQLFPIPQTEILADVFLTQNNGYH